MMRLSESPNKKIKKKILMTNDRGHEDVFEVFSFRRALLGDLKTPKKIYQIR